MTSQTPTPAPEPQETPAPRRTLDPQENKLLSLSPSRASNFKQCPQLFKFRAIDRLPEPASVYQARGNAIHLALERIFEYPSPERTRDRLFELFQAAWMQMRTDPEYEGLFATPEDEQKWSAESLQVIDNYLKLEDPGSIQPLERELDIQETFGEISIRGIIDRLEETPSGDLVITDYKTGRAPPERYSLAAFFALKIYALLIRTHMGRIPAELRLMYLGNGVVYSLPVAEQALNGMQKQLEALWTAIERGMESQHFPPRVSPLCDWCSFQSICPAFADADLPEPPTAPRPEPGTPLNPRTPLN